MVVPITKEDVVLELGCGLHKIHQRSVAIDKCIYSSADIIRDFVKRGIPFNDSWFSVVTCIDMIEHVEHYEDVVFLFNEIYRVLKVGGVCYLGTPNGFNDHMTHHRYFSLGSFDYLKRESELSPEMIYMRKSDGIVAQFDIVVIDHPESERALEIILTK